MNLLEHRRLFENWNFPAIIASLLIGVTTSVCALLFVIADWIRPDSANEFASNWGLTAWQVLGILGGLFVLVNLPPFCIRWFIPAECPDCNHRAYMRGISLVEVPSYSCKTCRCNIHYNGGYSGRAFKSEPWPDENASVSSESAFEQNLTDAWKQAGARFCWCYYEEFDGASDTVGRWSFGDRVLNKSVPLPAMWLDHYEPSRIAILPAPSVPFALFCFCSITDVGLQELAGFKNLQHLDIGGCSNVTDAGMQNLPLCLQRLRLPSTLSDTGVRKLMKFENLQAVDLASTKITDAGTVALANLKGMQSLVLARTRITDLGLRHLAVLQRLQILDIGMTDVTDEGMRQVARLTHLRKLSLYLLGITDEGIKLLAATKSLDTLSLEGCSSITDKSLTTIAGFKRLVNLSLRGSGVTDRGLMLLAGLTKLQHLNLINCDGIRDASFLTNAAHFRNLKTLQLSGTGVRSEGIARLRKLRRNLMVKY